MAANKSLKKGIFDFDIDIVNMLERPRVNQYFINGLEYPLTVVYAPSGYGKTTAALQFAKSAKARVVYMSLNEFDRSPQHFWNHLSTLYAQMSSNTGVTMAQLGFPSSNGLFLQFFEILRELSTKEKHILIIDDFHAAECPELDELFARISSIRLKDLNILMLSRTMPKFCSMDMKVKGFVYEITKEHLRFDFQEFKGYYSFHNIEISEEAAQKIDSFTEGWASAVYLSSLYFRQDPDNIFNIAKFDIDRLIENTVYKGYEEEVRDFLLKLSILDRFDMEICSYLTGSKNTYELLSRVLNENSFIKISENKQYFEMHGLFRDFLHNKLTCHVSINEKDLHIKAGEYYEYKNDFIMALMHLDCAREYEKMVKLILKNKCATTFSNQELMSVLSYMEKIPKKYFYKYPMLLLISAMSLTRTKHAAKSLELVAEVEKLCKNPEMSEEEKNKLLGEAAIVKALMSFNNKYKMLPYFKEACRLLPQGSELLGEKTSFTFGSPSILYLYYSIPGELDKLLDVFSEGFPYWEKVSSCGYGGDYLLKAEAAFERCDYESAEQDAYRAIYRAEEKNQNSIVIGAKLLIIKICAAKGKYSHAITMFRDMRELMNYRKALIYLSTIDMCTAIFSLLTGDMEDIPKWLYKGELAASMVNRAGFGIEYLIYGQVLLHNKEYIKLESIIPRMLEAYSMFTNQYGIIRANILAALASYHLYGLEKVIPYINSAFKITDADKVIIPYLEYGEYLLPVFQELKKDYEDFDADFSLKWLEDIIKQTKEYQKAISKFRTGFNAAHPERGVGEKVKLTKREAEILRLIADGLSGEEIAKRLYVTPINIRVMTSKIYSKLGVNSRVDAVRAAIDNGLV